VNEPGSKLSNAV
jgi:hypothetical protein